jgi:hypothetical protein
MAMSGRIKVGLWLPFTAEQTRTADPSRGELASGGAADAAGRHRPLR